MKVGDLVKFRSTMIDGIGLVTSINDTHTQAEQCHRNGSLYRVRWCDGTMGTGSYWKHELEVVSESR